MLGNSIRGLKVGPRFEPKKRIIKRKRKKEN